MGQSRQTATISKDYEYVEWQGMIEKARLYKYTGQDQEPDPNGNIPEVEVGEKVFIPHPNEARCKAEATGPLGYGKVFAIVSDEPIELNDLVALTRDIKVVPPTDNPRDYLAALSEYLRLPVLTDDGFTTREWSVGHVDYEIVAP